MPSSPTWLRLSIAGGATLLIGMGLGRFSYSPLIPPLIEAGHLTAWEAGAIGASNFSGYLAGAFAAPAMRMQWGEATTMRISLLTGLLALFACVLPWGFEWLMFWRALLGAVVGVMMIYCLAIATRSAPPGKLGAATGIVYTGVGIGILLSGSLVPWLLQFGIAAAWAGIGVVGAVAFIVALWGWHALEGENSTGTITATPHPKIKWTLTVSGLIVTRVLFSVGLIPHTIYWVDYLVRGLGNDIEFGGMHWVLFGLGAIGGTYLWGRLADQLGFRAGLALAFAAVASGIALPVLNSAGWALIASSLVVGAQPGLTAIMSGRFHQLMGPDGMAPVWRMSALISTILQAIAAYGYVTIFDLTESYVPIFLAGSASMALGTVIALLLRNPVESAK
ncbi:MAG: YbfB/YjiJ family MFS transporter [Alphaproteobacteria bacterium]|nr:YbfB/YjiJ family MFS transporter [Alphaproteobacteria bacterium]